MIIVASALLVSAAVERSGVIETVLRPIAPYLTTTTAQVVALVTAVAVLSAFVKNIGALAMLMPVAFQLARRKNGTSPTALLMPMSFGALLGGIVTLVGTSPNIIVARVREEIVGEPFGMFDFTPVGARPCRRRRDLPRVRLAAAARRPQGRGVDRGRVQSRRPTRPRSTITDDSPIGRQDRRRRWKKSAENEVEVAHADARRATASISRHADTRLRANHKLILQGRTGRARARRGGRKAQARARREDTRKSTHRATTSA